LINSIYTENYKGTISNMFIVKAQNVIKRYCGLEDLSGFEYEITELAYYYKQIKNDIGIKQGSQGSRSKTYTNEEIPSSIKASLPLPKIKML
jgi:hypothetical protein